MAQKFLVVFVLVCLTTSKPAHAGFTNGAACSSRNTAYLNPSRPLFPADPVKCVDITSMTAAPAFNKRWPIKFADTLYADHMNLTIINRTLTSAMPNLELADFTGNHIRRLPFAVDIVMPKIDTLLLAKNKIRIPRKRALLKSLTLRTLMLSHNKIRALQVVTFAKVPALRVLYLDSNFLKVVTAKMFRHLRGLKYLHLGNNLLKRVPEKRLMPKVLTVYIVKGNRLEPEDDLLA